MKQLIDKNRFTATNVSFNAKAKERFNEAACYFSDDTLLDLIVNTYCDDQDLRDITELMKEKIENR